MRPGHVLNLARKLANKWPETHTGGGGADALQYTQCFSQFKRGGGQKIKAFCGF